MPTLPVKRMILYKHGVGFFERSGLVGNAAQVELTFKKDEMNDVLKSLAAFPQGEGQVVSVSYETPEDKATALEKAPIVLSSDATLLDLLKSLRGRRISLHLVELGKRGSVKKRESKQRAPFTETGLLLGVDVEQELGDSLISIIITTD